MNYSIQEGGPLKKINIVLGSVFDGKKVPIIVKESRNKHPHNIFEAHFYSVEPNNITNHYLHYQETNFDCSKDLIGNEDEPWKVNVAIKSKIAGLNTFNDNVHYHGLYDTNKRKGILYLTEDYKMR